MPGSRPRITTTLLCALLAASHAVARGASSPPRQGADASSAPAQTEGGVAPAEPADTVAGMLKLVEGKGRKDSDAWYRLGLAYDRAGDVQGARDAFRQAMKLRSGHVAARAGLAHTLFLEGKHDEAEREGYAAYFRAAAGGRLDAEDLVAYKVYSHLQLQSFRLRCLDALPKVEAHIAARPGEAEWHRVRAQALVGLTIPAARLVLDPPHPSGPPNETEQKTARETNKKLYAEAAASLEKYLQLSPDARDAAHVREQFDALRFYARGEESDGGETVYAVSKVGAKAVITRKPEPAYTPEARSANVVGLVRVRAVLASDGTVKHVLVVKPLSNGLTENTVRAARDIKFKPAVLGGRPVSQHVVIEYNFHIY